MTGPELPLVGDKLFKTGGVGNLWAHTLPSEYGMIAVGYKNAADKLIEFLEHDSRDDSLVFPIMFCYRQYTELKLKEIGCLYKVFDESDPEVKKGHALHKLWIGLKQRIHRELDRDERKVLEVVEDLIKEFDNADHDSFTFRYPGEKWLIDDPLRQLDLGNLRAVMDRLAMFLDSFADYLEAGVDASDVNDPRPT